MHQAASDQPGPHPVDNGAGEIGVVGGHEPVGKHKARVDLGLQLHRAAVGEHRAGRHALFERTRQVEEHHLLLPLRGALVAQAREEGGHTVEPRPRPVGRALPHKGQGHGRGQRGRLVVGYGPEEIDGRFPEIAPTGGQQLTRELVVRHSVVQSIGQPALVGLHGIGPQLAREFGFDTQDIAPLHGPVVGESILLEELIDQCGALVGALVGAELAGRPQRRQPPGHVEIDPPHKHGVAAACGRGSPFRFQCGADEPVDLVGPQRQRGRGENAETKEE